MTDRAVDLVLRWYPAWWRERYEREVRTVSDDLRDSGRNPVRIVLDLLVGMMRVRRDGVGIPRSYPVWNARTRVSVATATLSFVLLAPLVLYASATAGLAHAGRPVTYSGFSFFPHGLRVVGHNGASVPAPPLTPAAPYLFWSETVIAVVLVLTLCTLVYGWASLAGAVRRSGPGRGRWPRLLCWTPALVFLVPILLSAATSHFAPHGFRSVGGHPPVPVGGDPRALHLVQTGEHVAVVGAWLLSVVAVAVVARRTEMHPSDLRSGARVSSTIAFLAVVLALAFVTFRVAAAFQAAQSAHGAYTVVSLGYAGLWPVGVIAALLVSYLTVVGAGRARQGSRMAAMLGG